MLILPGHAAKAQKGQFVRATYGVQYIQSRSFDDRQILTRGNMNFNYETTWEHGGGLTYINNFDTSFGYAVGALYSIKGQNYSGAVYDENLDSTTFTSSLRLNYIELPLLFRFNSTLEQPDRGGYLDLAFGFSLGYLSGGSIQTQPFLSEGRALDVDYLFRQFEVNTVVSTHFNYLINEKWQISTGIRASRTIGSVEKNDISIPDDTRLEYYYPVSLPKTARPSEIDLETRRSLKNVVIHFGLGITRRL